MNEKTELRKTAREAGVWYLLVALSAPYAYMYVPSQIIVRGNATQTAQNILAQEYLFRSGIAIGILSIVAMVLTAMTLYKLFARVDVHQARLMIVWLMIGMAVTFVTEIFSVTTLLILKADILKSFSKEQVHDLVTLVWRMHGYGAQLVQFFWGIWLIPFGLLVYKSGFIPRIFGGLLLLNGAAYMGLCFGFLLLPTYLPTLSQIAMPFIFLGEIPIILWLLIKGVK